jgi:hypothetical protein
LLQNIKSDWMRKDLQEWVTDSWNIVLGWIAGHDEVLQNPHKLWDKLWDEKIEIKILNIEE